MIYVEKCISLIACFWLLVLKTGHAWANSFSVTIDFMYQFILDQARILGQGTCKNIQHPLLSRKLQNLLEKQQKHTTPTIEQEIAQFFYM